MPTALLAAVLLSGPPGTAVALAAGSRPGAPTAAAGTTAWLQVSAGSATTCAIGVNHALYCWGANEHGQLGIGSTTARDLPAQVGTRANWAQVSVGGEFACAVRLDHTLWCWGYNYSGQLGIGTTVSRRSPAQVGTQASWAQVSTGLVSACAVRTDHTLWCWGSNTRGALGIGSMGSLHDAPVQAGTRAVWARVSVGGEHACAIRLDATLWCWGDNESGELGTGTLTQEDSPARVGTQPVWAQVATGLNYACAIRGDRSLWCWGNNTYGELGIGSDHASQKVPVQVG